MRGDINICVLPSSLGRVGDAYAELEQNPVAISLTDAQGPPVGGIAEYPQLEPGTLRSGGSSARNAFALAGLAAGSALMLTAGGWYARRRCRT